MNISHDVRFSISGIEIYGEYLKKRQVTWVYLQSGRILKQNNTASCVFSQKSQSVSAQPLSQSREEAALTQKYALAWCWIKSMHVTKCAGKKNPQNKTPGLIVWIPRQDAGKDNDSCPQEFRVITLIAGCIAFWWQFSLREWEGFCSSTLSGHLAPQSAGGKSHFEWIQYRCQIPTGTIQRP